jgi:hypothetical protein
MEKLTTLNYGQYILFGFLCTSLRGNRQSDLSISDLSAIVSLVVELTDSSLYDDDLTQCPDYMIMTNPSEAFDIFCNWYDENEGFLIEFVD